MRISPEQPRWRQLSKKSSARYLPHRSLFLVLSTELKCFFVHLLPCLCKNELTCDQAVEKGALSSVPRLENVCSYVISCTI